VRGARPPACDGPALDPTWTTDQAQDLARQAGLGVLGDHHWKVITSCREEAARTGHKPALQMIEKLTGFDAGELHTLFPGDFETIFTRIAGLTGHVHTPRRHPGDGSKES
jgi:sulfur relay (sulfurtransferase) DsrC/TusE family protein